MIKITSSVFKNNDWFEHDLAFEFESRSFEAKVMETKDQTYVVECFEITKNEPIEIDIPTHFGAFKSDVYTFIYDNIQRGYETK